MRHPVDSADAKELRERELDPPDVEPHDPRCVDGWVGADVEGRPKPCPMCHPQLERRGDGFRIRRREDTR